MSTAPSGTATLQLVKRVLFNAKFEIERFPVVNSIVYIQFGLQVLTTPPT
jgi:hypothetical protein